MALLPEKLKFEENFACISKLLINKGTQALKTTFQLLISHQSSNLKDILNDPSTKSKLTSLKKNKIIHKEKWDLLYPSTGSPDIENFDITLLFVLLRNICGLTTPRGGWDSLSPSSDTSISANIARIKFYRNKVYGQLTTTSLNDSEFEDLWQEISKALVGLGIQQTEIDELKKAPLSTDEPSYLERLQKGHTVDEKTKQDMEDIRNNVELEWKYIDESTKHRELFLKLIEYGRNRSVEVKVVGNVRVIFSEEFCIGEGSNATRVYLGLGKDGYGKAVKRIHRDSFIQLAQQEKKILNDTKARKSKYVVNYFYLDEDNGTDYVYLILDLCEESLVKFVKDSTLHDLQKALPDILRQILKGLADLHSDPNPILHRDLKPSNVLRDSKSKFLIADFGISRIMKNDTTTYKSNSFMGTLHWIAPESYCEDDDSVNKARYKRKSDVYNAGMVAYYVATKGKHPFGIQRYRLDNMLNGNPIGLDEIEDEALKDLLSWMLNLNPEERPYSNEALKHPFLMSDDEKFEMLCEVGNLHQIKTNDLQSSVVQQLNSECVLWKSQINWDVYDYFRTYEKNGKIYEVRYTSSWAECLRLIRNTRQHWNDQKLLLPQPELFYKIGDYRAYFLRTFPNLPVRVHAAVRSNKELKNKPELKNFFNFDESEPHQ
ncbi:serine/threonine-protein kinase/endoribonuclease IRE1-like isoform X2 [Xenia sp. Carnegie-2017]|uniref:serine/threonine-protein kinase/endoribonuclease IRE1-like isoform X2 n=1 Tax=Xenia sp. Carnegie-2017 TaxID=2897299 RepID=UPI001F046FCD|nr:serine/threonine-protein kinase/endoribonuclease IRE1-like isoform X2 [Xenia sp. Carnegie-2017]